MNKRVVSSLLVFVLALFLLPVTALAAGSLSNFTKTNTYAAGQFGDVPAAEWYAEDVRIAYEYGLAKGTTPTTFSPGQDLSLAEAIKFAACVNDIYHTGTLSLKNGTSLWYQPYVDYALSNSIIRAYPNYMAAATRSDMAAIFANALPDAALAPMNQIDDNAIPDVPAGHTYGAAIYKLYRAGILSGVDDSHAYRPNSTITRAEVATIVARLADSGRRKAFTMTLNGGPSDTPDTPDTSDTPQTIENTVTASPSTVSVAAAGAQALVYCTVTSNDFDRIVPVIGHPSVVSCTWGIPNKNTFPLTIIGLSAGTTTVRLQLLNTANTVLSETTVTVTVTGGGPGTTTTYFPGYYPVPDYGAYAGAAPYYIDYDALNGSAFYAYRISDITIDMAAATDGYITLLRQNGFVIDDLLHSEDGDDIFVLVNTAQHLKVYFTNAIRNDIPSIIVKATPF